MVTLVGVIGGTRAVVSFDDEDFACVTGGDSMSRLEELARSLSADMLLYVCSPLSNRGRFLVPDESVSSIGLRCGEISPSDFARAGVSEGSIMPASMTFCNASASAKIIGQVLEGKRV